MSTTKFDAKIAYDPAVAFDKEDARLKYYCEKYKDMRDKVRSKLSRKGTVPITSIFAETVGMYKKEAPPPLTFARFEYENYDSFAAAYLDICDPSEYIVAIAVFGDWYWWKQICDNPTIKPRIERLREELQDKLRSRAIQSIIETSNGDTTKAFEANKFLSTCTWKDKGDLKIHGRPKKKAPEDTVEDKRLAADMERMQLVISDVAAAQRKTVN